jgi:hypothetical protein
MQNINVNEQQGVGLHLVGVDSGAMLPSVRTVIDDVRASLAMHANVDSCKVPFDHLAPRVGERGMDAYVDGSFRTSWTTGIPPHVMNPAKVEPLDAFFAGLPN